MPSEEHLLLLEVMLNASILAARVSTHSRVVGHRILLRQGRMAGPPLSSDTQPCLRVRCGSW